MPEVLLTTTTIDDAESLVAIRITAMRESLEQVGRFDPERARQRFLSNFQPEYTRYIEVDKNKIGFVVVKPYELEDANKALLLDHLYIHPDYQAQGIGAIVLQEIFQEADAQQLAVQVGALRESASNRFYMRHGFEFAQQDEFDNYYIRPAKAK